MGTKTRSAELYFLYQMDGRLLIHDILIRLLNILQFCDGNEKFMQRMQVMAGNSLSGPKSIGTE